MPQKYGQPNLMLDRLGMVVRGAKSFGGGRMRSKQV